MRTYILIIVIYILSSFLYAGHTQAYRNKKDLVCSYPLVNDINVAGYSNDEYELRYTDKDRIYPLLLSKVVFYDFNSNFIWGEANEKYFIISISDTKLLEIDLNNYKSCYILQRSLLSPKKFYSNEEWNEFCCKYKEIDFGANILMFLSESEWLDYLSKYCNIDFFRKRFPKEEIAKYPIRVVKPWKTYIFRGIFGITDDIILFLLLIVFSLWTGVKAYFNKNKIAIRLFVFGGILSLLIAIISSYGSSQALVGYYIFISCLVFVFLLAFFTKAIFYSAMKIWQSILRFTQ